MQIEETTGELKKQQRDHLHMEMVQHQSLCPCGSRRYLQPIQPAQVVQLNQDGTSTRTTMICFVWALRGQTDTRSSPGISQVDRNPAAGLGPIKHHKMISSKLLIHVLFLLFFVFFLVSEQSEYDSISTPFDDAWTSKRLV